MNFLLFAVPLVAGSLFSADADEDLEDLDFNSVFYSDDTLDSAQTIEPHENDFIAVEKVDNRMMVRSPPIPIARQSVSPDHLLTQILSELTLLLHPLMNRTYSPFSTLLTTEAALTLANQLVMADASLDLPSNQAMANELCDLIRDGSSSSLKAALHLVNRRLYGYGFKPSF